MATTQISPIYTNPEAARAEQEYLVGVGKSIAKAEEQPIVTEIDGHKYVAYKGNFNRVRPVEPEEEKQPAAFETFSLQGLVDFIKTDVDGLFGNPERRHIVRVTNVNKVEVFSPVTGFFKKRYLVAVCNALVPQIPFDKYMDAESFQIMVQTRFEESDNRALVLKLSGSLRSEQTMQTADDGVSQKVTINKGVATDTYYLKYTFPGVDYWIIECNYVDEIIDAQQEAGTLTDKLRSRLKKSHLSLRRLLDVLRANDLTRAKAIVLIHLSNERSDERAMVAAVKEVTGLEEVHAAVEGQRIPLNQFPF